MKKHTNQTMPQIIGIDLGDRTSHYCVVAPNGEIVQQASFRNQPAGLRRHFAGAACRIALEAGAQSAWITRELEALGHEVIVAHPRQLKWITRSDAKNDPADARKLALLLRADARLLHPIEHRSAEQQRELAVIRARDAAVRARTLLVNAARSTAKGFGLRLPKSITARFGQRALAAAPQLEQILGILLNQIDALSAAITAYEKQIEQIARTHPEVERLSQIPGVGTLTALTFVLRLGRADRFAHSRDAASYLGLRPRQRQSGERDPQLGISKCGDPYLRKLLVQCAHWMLGPFGCDSALRQWGLAKGEGGGQRSKLRAVVAVARKLAVLLHRLWRTGEVYKPFPSMA